jgi:hypothetical protein
VAAAPAHASVCSAIAAHKVAGHEIQNVMQLTFLLCAACNQNCPNLKNAAGVPQSWHCEHRTSTTWLAAFFVLSLWIGSFCELLLSFTLQASPCAL